VNVNSQPTSTIEWKLIWKGGNDGTRGKMFQKTEKTALDVIISFKMKIFKKTIINVCPG
jgi:hypothetical protein